MFGLTDAQWQDLALSVNTHRKKRRLTPVEAGKLLGVALQHADLKELGARLGVTDLSTLKKISSLKDLPTDAVPLVEWGRAPATVSMSTAAQMVRLPNELAIEAIKAAVQYCFTKEEARQLVQVRQRTHKALPDCIDQVLLSRPRIERSELIIGSLLSPQAKRFAIEAGPEATSRKIRLLLAKRYPDVICQSVRVRGDRFSVLLKEEDAARLRAALRGNSLESTLTELLDSVGAESENAH